ncbi:hypothetical protein WJX74_003944 [Apatococcus lobatus]|uniref:Uncharacterized protein n=1 Tax=Apatococcus lobatus TaxID=904363 RepID=A0AAW1QAJ7_9CHLO
MKLAAGLVEAHISYLGPEDARQLFAWVLAVLQQYARDGRRANAGTVHSLNAQLREEANAEAVTELRALVRLLSNITQRDLADFGTPAGQPGIDVAQMVFVGLGIMVPLTTMDLLKFSALSVAYFQLLAHMLEVYPERILALPGAREALSTLLRALMQRMLEEPSGGNLVELAADAALPLILFCPKAFQSLGVCSVCSSPHPPSSLCLFLLPMHCTNGCTRVGGMALKILTRHHLVSNRDNKSTETQLTASLMTLRSSSNGSSNMDRPSRKAFRLSFSNFILVARSSLQMR